MVGFLFAQGKRDDSSRIKNNKLSTVVTQRKNVCICVGLRDHGKGKKYFAYVMFFVTPHILVRNTIYLGVRK